MNLKIYEKTKYNNIYKHIKNGTYAVDLSLGYDQYGKRIRTTKTGIKTEKEAKNILRDEELKKKNKNHIIYNYKFDSFLEEYYEWCILSKTVKEETLKKKKSRYNNHIIPFFKNVSLDKIDENVILKWHQYLDNKMSLKQESKNTIHRQLSAYFNWLLLHKRVISINPCLTVKNFSIPKKIIEYRTLEEMNKLWEVILNDQKKSKEIKLRMYAITKLLFFGGFRIGELLGFKIRDFDFDIINKEKIDSDEIKLHLNRTLYYSSNGYILGDGKTDESLGTIFIGKNVFQSIFDYIKYMNSIGYIFDEDDYIFANPNSNNDINVFSPTTISKQLNYFVDQAGLPHTKPKDMRSSHGTFLLSNGYSIEEVQTRLRHTKKETTEKYYATFYEENRKQLAKDIDKYA